jgi:putative transport protein
MSSFMSLWSGKGTATEIFVISLTALLGVLIGRIEIRNVKLGIAGVLFSGLLLGHFGAHVGDDVLHFVRELGLILFVYAVGVEVGPRFFSSFKSDGLKMNMMAASNVVLGFGVALIILYTFNVPLGVITGVMCGAVTNTPGLGAAQQAMAEQGGAASNIMGMGYAVAYPFGVIGIILAMVLIRMFFKIKVDAEANDYTRQIHNTRNKLESVRIVVSNPNLFGKNLSFIRKMAEEEMVISRIARNGKVIVANDSEPLLQGDVLHGVTSSESIDNLALKIGVVEVVEKNQVSGDLALFHVLVTSRKLAGRSIADIDLSRRHSATITRIIRGGMEILPTSDATIELGDTVRIVGKRDSQDDVRKELGNSVKELAIPNTIPIFIGIFLGIFIGSIPIPIPGLPAPAKLGLAGGPLVVAILLGYKTRIGQLDFYMTPGANMILRELGIVLFLSCVGLSAGGEFFKTMSEGGWVWMAYGAAITFIPIMIVGVVARLLKWNYLKICGVIAGSMTDPPALEYANSLSSVQAQSTAYATVYPLTMFLRVLLAQILVLLFI